MGRVAPPEIWKTTGHDSVKAEKGDKMQVVRTKVPIGAIAVFDEFACKLLKSLEARAGIEPAHKGFADLSLTTWVPRLGRAAFIGAFAPDRRSQSGVTGGRFGAGDEI